MEWNCYFHEGPCHLVSKQNNIHLERHSNSTFTWWEIYDGINYKYYLYFKTKKNALQKFNELIKETTDE